VHQAKKYLQPPPSKSLYEVQKRQLKAADCNFQNPNPITEGDVRSIYIQNNVRKEPSITEEYQKRNEKKFLLPAERLLGSPKKDPAGVHNQHPNENVKSIITGDDMPQTRKGKEVSAKCSQVVPGRECYSPREYGKNYFGKKKSAFAQGE